MDRVLMIADDLTGALDASVAFARAGISTCVGRDDYFLHSSDAARCAVQVTVVPSRHMSPEEAYRSVYRVVKDAREFTCIFKKTDSALRGNIGAELAAVRDAAGENTLYFVPALPKMNRITRNGVQYIDGTIPVARSVFAKDPFNPVRHSAIHEIIAETSQVPVVYATECLGTYPEGITVFDAETEEDVHTIAARLLQQEKVKLIAGCAGLANALPKVLDLEKQVASDFRVNQKLIVFCGSINPISLAQCAEAEKKGAPRFHLMEHNRFSDEQLLADEIAEASKTHQITLFDTGSTEVDPQMAVESGRAIAQKVSKIIGRVQEKAADATMFIIGGDTLIAFIDCLGIETIIPVEELFPGIVLAKYQYHKKWHYLISKSGGFGESDLLEQISHKLSFSGATITSGGEHDRKNTVPQSADYGNSQ